MATGDEDKKPSAAAADKGKEKAAPSDAGKDAKDTAQPKKDKDGNVIKDGDKPDEGKCSGSTRLLKCKPLWRLDSLTDIVGTAEELSEEDQKLKSELDMLVERLLESDKSLYKPSLEAIKDFIKTSTSSMTAVPKPLKFLRPHYESLEKTFESWPQGDDKVCLTAGDKPVTIPVLTIAQIARSGRCLVCARHDLF